MIGPKFKKGILEMFINQNIQRYQLWDFYAINLVYKDFKL